MFVCCAHCVLSGTGLWDKLITRPEESYRLWRVVVCDNETSWYEETIDHAGLQSQRNKHNIMSISVGSALVSPSRLHLYSLTYSIEHSPSWEADRFSAREEIPRIFWQSKVHYHFHLSLFWARSTQSMPPPPQIPLPEDPFNIILPSVPGSSKRSFSVRFPHQNPEHTSPLPIRAICPAHLIVLELITRIIFSEEYRSSSSSLCSFLHSVLSGPSQVQIPSSAPYSPTTPACVPPPVWATKFHTHTNNRQNYSPVNLNLYIFG
jgi:hypothetical protein